MGDFKGEGEEGKKYLGKVQKYLTVNAANLERRIYLQTITACHDCIKLGHDLTNSSQNKVSTCLLNPSFSSGGIIWVELTFCVGSKHLYWRYRENT